MILVTVGTQLPFNRLIEAADNIAAREPTPFLAQIGKGRYQPKHMEWTVDFDSSAFDRIFQSATVVVSHAGIGTVMTARKFNKPIILVPRKAALGEHRNDHQLATARQLTDRPGIYIADSEEELARHLGRKLQAPADHMSSGPQQRDRLITRLKTYIDDVR